MRKVVRVRRSLLVVIIIVAVGLIGLLLVVVLDSPGAAADTIVGTVITSGCTAGAADLHVSAQRVEPGTPTPRWSAPNPVAAPQPTVAPSSTTSTSSSTTSSSTTTTAVVTSTSEPGSSAPPTSTTTITTSTSTTRPPRTVPTTSHPVTIAPGITTPHANNASVGSAAPTGRRRGELVAELMAAHVVAAAGPTLRATVDVEHSDALRYHLHGTTPAGVYLMTMSLSGACAHARFVGTTQRFVVAPAAHALAVVPTIEADDHGLLQIYAGARDLVLVDGVVRDHWDVSDNVPASVDPPATRVFRWGSAATGIHDGSWQLSTQPMTGDCSPPAHLVASGDVSAANAAKVGSPEQLPKFTLDVSALAKSLVPPTDSVGDLPGPHQFLPSAPTSTSTPAGGSKSSPVTPTSAPKAVQGAPTTIPSAEPPALKWNGDLYLRVVPRSASHRCAGSPTNEVVIHYGAPGVVPAGSTKLLTYRGGVFPPSGDVSSGPLAADWVYFDSVVLSAEPTRQMQWSTTATGITHGELQLSSNPFDGGCGDTPGLLATQDLAVTGTVIDLKTPTSPPNFTFDLGAFADHLSVGHTFYVRVVPRTADAHTCGGAPSNTVFFTIVATPPLPPPSPPAPTPPKPPVLAPLEVSIVKYQAFHTIRSDDGSWHFIALADHEVTQWKPGKAPPSVVDLLLGQGHLTAGQAFAIVPPQPPSPGWFEQLVDALVSVISFPATFYEQEKNLVIDFLGGAIGAVLGIDCSGPTPDQPNAPESSCFTILKTFETVALEAIGLPPELPDAKALFENGGDYLSTQLAGQLAGEAAALGIPITAAQVKQGLDAAKDKIIQQMAATTNANAGFDCSVAESTQEWCVFDDGARSPILTVSVTRPEIGTISSHVPNANSLCIGQSSPTVDSVYAPSCVPIPDHMEPGSTITIPIPLRGIVEANPVVAKYRQEFLYGGDSKSPWIVGCFNEQALIPEPYHDCYGWADGQDRQVWGGLAISDAPATFTLRGLLVGYVITESSGAAWKVGEDPHQSATLSTPIGSDVG